MIRARERAEGSSRPEESSSQWRGAIINEPNAPPEWNTVHWTAGIWHTLGTITAPVRTGNVHYSQYFTVHYPYSNGQLIELICEPSMRLMMICGVCGNGMEAQVNTSCFESGRTVSEGRFS